MNDELYDRMESLHHTAGILVSRQRWRRLVASLCGVSALAFLCVAAIVGTSFAYMIAAAWVLLTTLVIVWHLSFESGHEGAVCRAYETLLTTSSWRECSLAIVDLFTMHHTVKLPAIDAPVAKRDLDELLSMVLVAPIEANDVIVQSMAGVMLGELKVRVNACHADMTLRDAERDARRIRDEAAAERTRIIGQALDDAADLRAGRIPRNAPWLAARSGPSATFTTVASAGVDPAVLRSLFAHAADEAARGVVSESPVAAAVLSGSARWSSCVASQEVSTALLALFDPICAPALPPPSARPPRT